MTAPKRASAAKNAPFKTTLTATGNNTGIVVPADLVVDKLAAGKRPAVVVNVNGYEYRNTVGSMGGKHMISVSAAIRKVTGLRGWRSDHGHAYGRRWSAECRGTR